MDAGVCSTGTVNPYPLFTVYRRQDAL